jgi:hypothetical protein
MPRKLETENHVKELAKDWYDGLRAWHYAPIQNGMGVHGIPDRIGCVPVLITPAMVGKVIGAFVAVESKRPGRRGEPNRGLSPQQQMQLDKIYEARGVGIVCDSQDDLDRAKWLLTAQALRGPSE